MWFDSHCHLDAPEFSGDLGKVVERAKLSNLDGVLIPAVQAKDFDQVDKLVESLANELPKTVFTLGIHPLFTNEANEADIDVLAAKVDASMSNPRFVGIGEIGLDYFVTHLDNQKQEWFFEEQLKLANKFSLPVILHVRRSQDQILKRLRRIKVSGGIAHAFNGSFVQANNFLDLNFKLGFGGAMTYERALQIRRLATELSLSAFVLETDSPDIPPAWLVDKDSRRNEPSYLEGIAKSMAALRAISETELAQVIDANVCKVLPRWQALCESLQADI